MQVRPSPSQTRDSRRERILACIGRERVRNQAELQQLLEAEGFAVNQATLSRDLRDLGVVKGPEGYELPTGAPTPETSGSSLWHAVHAWLLSAVAAQNLVVVRTPPSGASPMALALDRTPPDGMVGTIAGDDTVLAVCTDAGKARSIVRRLLALKAMGAQGNNQT